MDDKPRTTLSDRTQVYPEHRKIDPKTGLQAGYVVLAHEEVTKGFIRPYRDSYVHNTCGKLTTMGRTIAETYARDPEFYSATFCAQCCAHFPIKEFMWDGTTEQVGS